VGHNHHGLLPRQQELLQPGQRVHVQVIGRLVQQQQIRGQEERLRERDAHPPPPGELAGGGVLHLRVEAETRQNDRGARLRTVAVQLLQPLVHLREGDSRVLVQVHVVHFALQVQQPLALGVHLEHGL